MTNKAVPAALRSSATSRAAGIARTASDDHGGTMSAALRSRRGRARGIPRIADSRQHDNAVSPNGANGLRGVK